MTRRGRFTALGPGLGLLLACGLASGLALASPADERQGQTCLGGAHFLGELVGAWHGEAEVTPVGPRPYDIAFKRDGEHSVSGIANPGAARHHWRFSASDRQTRARFLSTFRGNETPMHFQSAGCQGPFLVFTSRARPMVSLLVAPAATRLRIRVLFDQALHVRIHLQRQRSIDPPSHQDRTTRAK